MRGLPFSATPQDILGFFQGVEILGDGEESVAMTCTPDGRPTGEAYVEFASEDAQKEAFKRHKNMMGSRYVELFNSTKGDMVQAAQQSMYYLGQAGTRKRGGSGGGAGEGAGVPGVGASGTSENTSSTTSASGGVASRGGYAAAVASMPTTGPASQLDGATLKLRGLPYAAGVDDITSFFEGFSLADEGIQVCPSPLILCDPSVDCE